MKISDITNENLLTEAPVSRFKQGLRKMGAGLAGMVGSDAPELRGKIDTGTEANNLFNQYKNQLGRQGANINDVSADNLAKFLNYNGYQSPITGNKPLGKSGIEQAILKAVQMNAGAEHEITSQNQEPVQQKAPTAAKPTATKEPVAQPAAQPVKGTQPSAMNMGKLATAADKGAIKGATTTGTKQRIEPKLDIPSANVEKIKAQIAKLKPEEKQALLKDIGGLTKPGDLPTYNAQNVKSASNAAVTGKPNAIQPAYGQKAVAPAQQKVTEPKPQKTVKPVKQPVTKPATEVKPKVEKPVAKTKPAVTKPEAKTTEQPKPAVTKAEKPVSKPASNIPAVDTDKLSATVDTKVAKAPATKAAKTVKKQAADTTINPPKTEPNPYEGLSKTELADKRAELNYDLKDAGDIGDDAKVEEIKAQLANIRAELAKSSN